ncbi:hypothetical protein EJB05_37868 [Eragrostis curvula]|uniref:F-box domain-containing protein n=1 Tax=Eragrostis curvula TaxID=38414 RepID=A0A5J9TSP7_9POAL|nr:hypothetical protein EJB05_37868 [Eragrostis curvula]
MEAAAKQGRAGSGSICDRLSVLPDELLRHVLSFLPAQQVVQTTVLSKRWEDLWRSMPGINLDLTDFQRGSMVWEFRDEAWERLEEFATNLLVLHNAPCLDVFRLKADFVPHYSRRHLDAWIRRVVKDNPLVLQLLVSCFDAEDEYYYYQLPHLGSSPCRRLKRLDLNGLYLDHSFAEKLQSWFPHLEDLILRECRQGFSVLQSDKLKNLDIKQCEYVSSDVFVIRVPALASLHLDIVYCYYKKGISLDAGKSLMKASVDIHTTNWSQRSEVMLLGGLFSVANLELIGFQPEAMLDEEFDKLPIFNNLRTLSLGLRYHAHDAHAFKALGKFLQKSPNLENLCRICRLC